MKKQILILPPFLFVCFSAYAAESRIPKEFEYEGEVYRYEEGFKEFESAVHADIDGDGKTEEIVMFGTRYGDADIPRAFAFIYDAGTQVIIPQLEYPKEIKTCDIDGDSIEELILLSQGGMHYTQLEIFKYGNGMLTKIFKNGSACPVEFKMIGHIPTVKVGRAKWEKEGWCYASGDYHWQVYAWNGKNFVYREELSTIPEVSEREEVQRYIDKIRGYLKERKRK